MSHQDQSGMRIYLTISLPNNNKESISPPGFRKGVCHKVAIEADKNNKSLYLITHFVISNFLNIFLSSHICQILVNSFYCTLTHGGRYSSEIFSILAYLSSPFFRQWQKTSYLVFVSITSSFSFDGAEWYPYGGQLALY